MKFKKMQKIENSSNIDSIYEVDNDLIVKFLNGCLYKYKDASNEFEPMVNAESKGVFFSKVVKARYEAEKLDANTEFKKKEEKIINPDIFMALDLEMNQPSENIIEIGYSIGNIKTGEILLTKSLLVDPGEGLNPYIENLCNVSFADETRRIIPRDADLYEAFRQMVQDHKEYQCNVNLVTWGCGDTEKLRSSLDEVIQWPFGRRYTDVKTLSCEILRAQNRNIAGGLSKSMNKHALKFEGTKHQADDDAKNTLRLYFKLNKMLEKLT